MDIIDYRYHRYHGKERKREKRREKGERKEREKERNFEKKREKKDVAKMLLAEMFITNYTYIERNAQNVKKWLLRIFCGALWRKELLSELTNIPWYMLKASNTPTQF